MLSPRLSVETSKKRKNWANISENCMQDLAQWTVVMRVFEYICKISYTMYATSFNNEYTNTYNNITQHPFHSGLWRLQLWLNVEASNYFSADCLYNTTKELQTLHFTVAVLHLWVVIKFEACRQWGNVPVVSCET